MRYFIGCSIAAMICAFSPTYAAAETCDSLTMQITATVSNDPGFEDMYKYTIEGYWNVGEVPDTFTALVISFPALCACECDSIAKRLAFTSYGNYGYMFNPHVGQEIIVEFEEGDPDCPFVAGYPTISYGLAEGYSSQGSLECNGTWIFYSWLPPLAPAEYFDAVTVNYGPYACTGNLFGQIPMCLCTVPTDVRSWGWVKSMYR